MKEKVKREETLRTLQGQNATLGSIIETSDKIDAVYQGVEYKKDQISQRLQPFLDNTFGKEYRDKIRDEKYYKIHRDLLEEREFEIEAEAAWYPIIEIHPNAGKHLLHPAGSAHSGARKGYIKKPAIDWGSQ